MGRALDICLEQLGLSAAAPAPRRIEPPPEPAAAPTRRRNEHVHEPAVHCRSRAEASMGARRLLLRRGEGANLRASADRSAARPGQPDPCTRRPVPDQCVRPGPELPAASDKHRSMHIESPRLALPPPTAGAKPATAVGQLIESCRVGLTTGVAFLVNRDGVAITTMCPARAWRCATGRAFERELRTGLRVLLERRPRGRRLAVLMPLAGAVVVPGNLVVQSNVKAIQHPTGGVVAEIPVHNGSGSPRAICCCGSTPPRRRPACRW